MGRYEWSVALNIAQLLVLWRAMAVLDKSVTLNRRLVGASDPVPLSQRLLAWLTRTKAPHTVSNGDTLPFPMHGDSLPNPSLNSHVGSSRPVTTPRSPSSRTRPVGSFGSGSASSRPMQTP